MKNKKLQWALFGLCLLTALIVAGLLLPPSSQPKAQSSQLKTAVNNIPAFQDLTPAK